MTDTTIEIKGLDKVIKKMDKIGDKDDFRKATREAVLYVQGRVPPYPPPPPTSTYVQTGQLGRSITSLQGEHPNALSRVGELGGDIVGIVGTNLEYAPYVIDKERQAYMHKGRWYTLQDVVTKASEGIRKVYEAMINRWLNA